MRIPFLVSLGIGVIAACTTPTGLCGCSPPPPPSALVVGTVRTTGGAPLRDAIVSATGKRGSCPGSGPAVAADYGALPSDSAGRYRIFVALGSTALDSMCVQLIARRSAIASTDTLAAPLVALQLRTTLPYDSTRVDFTFP